MKIAEIVISCFIVIISQMVYIFSYKKLTDKMLNVTPLKVFTILIFAALAMLNSLFNVNYFKLIMGYLIIYFICKIWFKDSIKVTFYYSFVLTIVYIMMEFIICFNVFSLFFTSVDELNSSLAAKNALTIIMTMSTYFIVAIKPVKNIINRGSNIVFSKWANEILLSMLLIIGNLLSMHFGFNYKSDFFYIIAIIIITVITFLLIFLLRSNYSKEKLQIRNEFLIENIKNYEIIADDYRELKHNLKHDLMAIRSVANEQSQTIIDQKIKKYNKSYDWLVNIGQIPKGLQGLLYLKLYEIKKEKLNIEVNNKLNEENTPQINIKSYTLLCDALGITIDNAIEAAKNSSDKSIYIDLEKNNSILNIKIMNTFNGNLDLDKLGKKNYSTKKIKSGIGLNYINQFDKKSITIKKEIINNIFIVSLTVPISG